jgi:hypothetical protein
MARAFRIFKLEHGLVGGATLIIIGLGIALYSLLLWNRTGFGPMNPVLLVRLVSMAMVTIILGVEIVFSSFFLSILGLARK